ncbi:hypothetical protein BH23ACI1_BH23ACI1_13750 [soil metagenome]
MRKFLSMAVVTALAATSTPTVVVATENSSIAVAGTAYSVNMQPLSNAEVQIRDLKSGSRVNTTLSDVSGSYSFKGLRPGTYVVEVVDKSGKVLGMSAPFVLGAAPSVTVSVVAVGQGTATSGEGAGFSFLGMGPVTSLVVVGAAGAAAVTAVVATRPDASPSR